MGYTGPQYDDSDGLSIGLSMSKFTSWIDSMKTLTLGTAEEPVFEYKYLDGRCRHYKLVGKRI